jgi:hypothetical protein
MTQSVVKIYDPSTRFSIHPSAHPTHPSIDAYVATALCVPHTPVLRVYESCYST